MISNEQNEKRAYHAMACAKGLNDYADAYRWAGCDETQFVRFLRIYEIRLTSDPSRLERLASHHILRAEEYRVSDVYWAVWEDDLELKCESLRAQTYPLLDRIVPACEAIQKLGLDPDGECRRDLYEIFAVLDRAFNRVDDEVKHLTEKAQLEERWSRYKEILQNWNEWHFSSFIERFKSILNNNSYTT